MRRLPRWAVVLISLAVTAAIGVADYLTGRDMSFLAFYLVPIGFASWFAGGWSGAVVALLSGTVWFLEDVATPRPTPALRFLPAWNVVVKAAFLLVIAWLFYSLRRSLEHEESMARTDPLTGAANRRMLFDLVDYEVRAMPRHGRPVSLAFVDLDDFKGVNDTMGHEAGDELLQAVVRGMKAAVRGMDTVARVGGDEFVVLLPGADEGQAAEVMDRVRAAIMREVEEGKWPVGLSIGTITCLDCPGSPDELVGEADALMYKVKKSGKGRTLHEVIGGSLGRTAGISGG